MQMQALSMLQPAGRKRGREDDDDDDGSDAFAFFGAEKRQRTLGDAEDPFRPHSLPLRDIFSTPFATDWRPTSFAGASDESTNGSPESHSPPELSCDIDMNDDTVSIVDSHSPPTPVQSFSRPAKLAPAPFRPSLEGRVPTPLHNGFFTTRVPSITWSNSDVNGMDLEDAAPQMVRSPMAPPPRRYGQRDHPMPSPIRESLLSPALLSPAMNLPPLYSPSIQSPRGSLMSPTYNGAMETSLAAASQMSRLSMNSDRMETDDALKENAADTGISPRKGRARSGALYREKMVFAYGYRSDCEKCRARVPGHNSHYLPMGA